jgi:(p)ppGpp synthase/HD superfamily hydrolase
MHHTNPAALYSTEINKALVFSAKAHLKQLRKGTDIPYITHP